jgi:hypothetical protein
VCKSTCIARTLVCCLCNTGKHALRKETKITHSGLPCDCGLAATFSITHVIYSACAHMPALDFAGKLNAGPCGWHALLAGWYAPGPGPAAWLLVSCTSLGRRPRLHAGPANSMGNESGSWTEALWSACGALVVLTVARPHHSPGYQSFQRPF